MFHPKERVVTLPGNHVTMCRFQSHTSPGYLAVHSAILEIRDATSGTLPWITRGPASTTKDSVIPSILRPTSPKSEMEDALEDSLRLSELLVCLQIPYHFLV
jgi:hypothetical protein